MIEPKASKNGMEDFLRRIFRDPLEKIASFLLRLGLMPDHITLLGMIGTIGAAVLIAFGYLPWAGLVAGLIAPLDAVDGAMARQRAQTSRFGAFFDSTIDRYDELFLFAGLTWYFQTQNDLLGVMLTFAAAAGAVLVSYTRARAEALGMQASVGVMTRIGRAVVLIIGLLISQPLVSVGIIAILANVTAIQRIVTVWQQSKAE